MCGCLSSFCARKLGTVSMEQVRPNRIASTVRLSVFIFLHLKSDCEASPGDTSPSSLMANLAWVVSYKVDSPAKARTYKPA
jgi:hypothetical protein